MGSFMRRQGKGQNGVRMTRTSNFDFINATLASLWSFLDADMYDELILWSWYVKWGMGKRE